MNHKIKYISIKYSPRRFAIQNIYIYIYIRTREHHDAANWQVVLSPTRFLLPRVIKSKNLFISDKLDGKWEDDCNTCNLHNRSQFTHQRKRSLTLTCVRFVQNLTFIVSLLRLPSYLSLYRILRKNKLFRWKIYSWFNPLSTVQDYFANKNKNAKIKTQTLSPIR